MKHVAFKCQSCPVKIRNTVLALEGQQDAKDQVARNYQRSSRFEERPKYGSRKVFFQRVWARLHDESSATVLVGKKAKKGLLLEEATSDSSPFHC